MKKIEFDLENFFKRRILNFKQYIIPYLKNEKTVKIKLSKTDTNLIEDLHKILKINKNLIANTFIYRYIITKIKEEDERIISVCELLESLEKAKDIDNKILFIDDNHKYKITKIK